MNNKEFWTRVADLWIKRDKKVIPQIIISESPQEMEAFLGNGDLDIDLDDFLGDL